MSRKIKNDQYEVIVNFKNANCLSISAEFLPTNEHFCNNTVQLMRINKDTVIAALEKKSEKNLRCQFEQIFQDGQKQLKIIFIVNFDFLPEFREQIRLEYIQQKQSIKKYNFATMHAEIQELNSALESMETNGSTYHTELASTSANSDKKNIWEKDVKPGKYILRLSGTVSNSTNGFGANNNDKISFYLSVPGQKEEKVAMFRNHYQASYHYPFALSEVLDCSEGTLKVSVNSTIVNSNIMNLHFVLNRVTEVN